MRTKVVSNQLSCFGNFVKPFKVLPFDGFKGIVYLILCVYVFKQYTWAMANSKFTPQLK